jgi:hypothetical protein
MAMKRTFWLCALLALVVGPTMASAQVKEIPGDTVTRSATIEAIDHATRQLTVKLDDGTFEQFTVPDEVKRFKELKVGDTITAKYYTNLVLRLKKAGEKDVDTDSAAETKSVQRVGGTVATQRTITATITQLDAKVPSITFEGPNGWKYSSKVQDKKAIEKVKVGDKVDITWTEAVLLSVAPFEKK